jgi:hypothetical protein
MMICHLIDPVMQTIETTNIQTIQQHSRLMSSISEGEVLVAVTGPFAKLTLPPTSVGFPSQSTSNLCNFHITGLAARDNVDELFHSFRLTQNQTCKCEPPAVQPIHDGTCHFLIATGTKVSL